MWWDRTGQLFDEASVIEFQTWLFTYGLWDSRFSLADVSSEQPHRIIGERKDRQSARMGENANKYFPRKYLELNLVLSDGRVFLIRQVRYCAGDLSEPRLVPVTQLARQLLSTVAPLNQNNYVLEMLDWERERRRNWYPTLSVCLHHKYSLEMQWEVKMVPRTVNIFHAQYRGTVVPW